MFFKKAWAFFKRDLREHASYKSAVVFDFLGVVTNMVIFFFVAKVLGESANAALKDYGGDYFSFVLIGIVFAGCQTAAMGSFGGVLAKERGFGTLEAILVTPTSLATVILSGSLYSLLFACLQVVFYFSFGAFFFDFDMARINLPASLVVLLLTITSLGGLGLISAGFLLLLKRGNPIDFFIHAASRFLAGVYFPVAILPLWVQKFSLLIPLTYSLEAMRKAVLKGEGIFQLAGEINALLLFTLILLPAGIGFFGWAVKRTKQEGSLLFE